MCILHIMLMLDAVYFQSQLCDFNSWRTWVARDTACGLCVIVLIASFVLQPFYNEAFYLSYTTDSSTVGVVLVYSYLCPEPTVSYLLVGTLMPRLLSWVLSTILFFSGL